MLHPHKNEPSSRHRAHSTNADLQHRGTEAAQQAHRRWMATLPYPWLPELYADCDDYDESDASFYQP